jgi:hypothetical protein
VFSHSLSLRIKTVVAVISSKGEETFFASAVHFAILHKYPLVFSSLKKPEAKWSFLKPFSLARTVHRFELMSGGPKPEKTAAHPCVSGTRPVRSVIARFLLKIAKHTALLACLLLIGRAKGEPIIGPPSILLIIIGAAFIHSVGRWLQIGARTVTTFYDR